MKSRLIAVLVLLALLSSVAAMPASASSSAAATSCKWHEVERGQNLFRIARSYGVSMLSIQRANNIRNPNLIYRGQRLCIPKKGSSSVQPPPAPPPPPSGGSTYPCTKIHVVKKGEYANLIASRYGTTVKVIKKANGLKNANKIYVGQKLEVPATCKKAAPQPKPPQPKPPAGKPPWTGDYELVCNDAGKCTLVPNAKCVERPFLQNGSFEKGFHRVANGDVGNYWGAFQNGGQATYGFYDETWAPLISHGSHSQLIEIASFCQTTLCRGGSDPDRYAGIFQTVHGLVPGAKYKLSMSGMLRALADDDDRDNDAYRVQWGFTPNGSTNWQHVQNWVTIPWDKVYPREEPGAMEGYSATFRAPSGKITIFIRAWKKWGTVGKELDVNVDAVRLECAR